MDGASFECIIQGSLASTLTRDGTARRGTRPAYVRRLTRDGSGFTTGCYDWAAMDEWYHADTGNPEPTEDAVRALEFLHRDDALVAVAKPSGLSVHRGDDRSRTVAMTLVRNRLGRWVYPVHRLDRATSGVLLLALSSEVAAALQLQFQDHRVVKRYLALVRGIPPEQGVIDHPVPRSGEKGSPRIDAVTEFRRLATFERFALMEARPKTGRRHQIRRHFKHLSHPLVGDVRYGKGDINRHFRERFGLHRLALHALELTFEHPDTGGSTTVHAPVPEDLARPLEAMGLLEPWD